MAGLPVGSGAKEDKAFLQDQGRVHMAAAAGIHLEVVADSDLAREGLRSLVASEGLAASTLKEVSEARVLLAART